MTSAFFGQLRSVLVGLCTVVAMMALLGCGGDEGTPGSSVALPTPTPTPGPEFTGNFAGTLPLDAGRTGAVLLSVQSNDAATGTLTISGGTTVETVPLTGFAALTSGDFSLSGSSTDRSVTATVSGTLPHSGGGSGILVIQIGTTFFRGTINAA